MTALFWTFMNTRVGKYIAFAVAAILGFLGIRTYWKNQGESDEKDRSKTKDQDNATNIRNRVRDANRVQPDNDDRKFRD
jgi:hypothetical protein